MKIKLNLLGIELELINRLGGTLSDEEVGRKVQRVSGLISQAVLHHRRTRWNPAGDLEKVTHILACPGIWGVAIKVGDGEKWVDVESNPTTRRTPNRTTPDEEYSYEYLGNGCYRMKKETNKEKETL